MGQHNLSDRERIGEILADFRRRKAELGKRHELFIDVVEDEARGIFSPRLLSANAIPPELSRGGLISYKIPMITDVRTRAVRRAATREIVKQLSKNDKLMGISKWMMYQYYLQILMADPDPVNRQAAIDAHEVLGRRLWSVIGISDINEINYRVTNHLLHTSTLAVRIRLPHLTRAFDKAIVAFKAGYKLGSDEFFSDVA